MTFSYVLKRILLSVFPLLGTSVIGFTLFRVMPGDPALLMVGIGASQSDIEKMRIALGENLPIYQQYFIWLRDILTGNYGTSIFFQRPVASVILQRLPATLELVAVAIILAMVLGVGIGVLSAVKEGTWIDSVSRGISYIGFGIPDFIWGIIFVLLFGVFFRVLPVSGRINPFISVHQITGFLIIDSILNANPAALISSIRHIILPSLALALVLMSIIQRTARSSLVEVLREDYITTDRMKGLKENYIIFVRALKNSLIPTITILGVQFTFLMGGTVLIELIFGWPGIGSLIFTAIQYKDLPLLQGIVMFYAFTVILVNLFIDILYSFLNPKIRYGK